MRRHDSLLATLAELQVLDRVARSGWVLRGVPDPESIAEHGWHVAFLVWALGRDEPGLDVGHALALALVHDIGEARLGDLPRTASHYLPPGAKHDAEEAAVADLLAPLGAAGIDLYREYRERRTAAARFVADCDKLHLMLKVWVYEGWGAGGLGEFWDNPANFPSDEFPPVAELFRELLARREEPPFALRPRDHDAPGEP